MEHGSAILKGQMNKPSVVLADDNPELLQSIQKLLESEFRVLASVSDGCELIKAVNSLGPDVIVTDISMEGLSGIHAARRLKLEHPDARIVFLTVHDEPAFLAEARKIGVLGYVIKQSANAELIPALRAVLQCRSFISSALLAPVAPRTNSQPN